MLPVGRDGRDFYLRLSPLILAPNLFMLNAKHDGNEYQSSVWNMTLRTKGRHSTMSWHWVTLKVDKAMEWLSKPQSDKNKKKLIIVSEIIWNCITNKKFKFQMCTRQAQVENSIIAIKPGNSRPLLMWKIQYHYKNSIFEVIRKNVCIRDVTVILTFEERINAIPRNIPRFK